MAALPYMPLYVADYLADASHLTTTGHGAYLLLIMNYWQRGKPLPSGDDDLAQIARMPIKDWKKIRPAIVAFFVETDGQWKHNRIEAELERVRNRSRTSVAAGRASAQAKAQRKLNDRSTSVEQTFNHTDTDTKEEDEMRDARADSPSTDVSRETENPQRDQWAELETRLREAAGWQREPSPSLSVVGPVIAALEAGVDLDLDLLPAARAHGPRITARTTWTYILKAAITNRNDRLGAAADAAKPISPTRGNGHGKPDRTGGNIATILGTT